MTQSDVVRFSSPPMSARVRTATVSWRFFVGRVLALSTTILCGLLLAAQSAKADDFTFHDTKGNGPLGTDIITVTNDTPGGTRQFQLAGCNSLTMELPCLFNLTGPGTSFFLSSTGPAGLTDAGETVPPSDEISISALSSLSTILAQVNFDSCNDEVIACIMPIPSCAALTGGCFQEGTRVQVATINWSNGSQDRIFAISDTEVPEPSSLILLGSGLLMAGGFLRHRLVNP